MQTVRIDKWLWAARLYKHRSMATRACAAGHVKLDGETVKASKAVRAGDRIEALTPGGRRIVEIVALRRFLLAYFLYANGVFTGIYFAGPIAQKSFGFGTTQVIFLFLVVQVSAFVGAFAMSKPTDVLGPKRVVQVSLALWLIAVVIIVFAPDAGTNLKLGQGMFWVAGVIAGLGLGTVQSASRAFMATLIPEGREDEFFGFYALCGKSSAPIGTALFGIVSWATGGSQQTAIAAITVFFIAGFLLLRRVDGGGPTVQQA